MTELATLALLTVEQKRERIKQLGTLIGLHNELLPMQVRMEIENEQLRTQYRLKQLRDLRRRQFKDNYPSKECDIKIAAMEKVLQILNNYRTNGTQD